MSVRRTALVASVVLAAASGFSRPSAADTWPVSRHDAARTGASVGACPIQTPLVAWRAFMGGRPSARTARMGLGNPAMLVAAVGGRFVARNALTQLTLWKSEILGVGTVEDIADLDGDSKPEVIVRTETRVLVLDGASGQVRWTSPETHFRTPVAARVIDLDGNGLPDLYLDECLSCAKPGDMAAGAFSFASGFVSPKTLWMRPANATPAAAHTGTDAILDLDGNGFPEIVLTSNTEIVVLRGNDGSVITTLSLPDAKGKPFPQARAIAAELDGLPGKELVIVALEGQISGEAGPAGVTAYRLDPQTGANALLYRHVAADYGDTMVDLADVVSDLDGDGLDEVIVSLRSAASGAYTTEILKGAAGNVERTLPGLRFEGAADLDNQMGAELVVASAGGLSVFHDDPQGLNLLAGPIANVRAFSIPNPEDSRRGALDRRLAVVPRPGFSPAFLVGEPSSDLPYAELASHYAFSNVSALVLGPSGAASVGKHDLVAGEITGLVRADFATRPYPQIGIGTSAGTVIVLDNKLNGTNGIVFWGGKATGSYVGGAFPPSSGARGGPLIGADTKGEFVVFPGSPLGTYIGDARFASLIIPPIPRFFAPEMGASSVMDLGPLGVSLVGVEEHALVARRTTDGSLLSVVDLGPGSPQSTPLPMAVAGEVVPRVGIDWRVDGVAVAQSAVDFQTSKMVWQGEPLPFGGFFGSGVGDLDGDGTDEWYSLNTGLNRRNAKTGVVTTIPGNNMYYALPMLAPFRAGKGAELLLQAGASAPRLLDKNLVDVWQSTSPENVNGMAGSRFTCASGTRFITPAVLSPFVRAYSGDTGVLLGERVLAGGAVFTSFDAAKAAGARVGVLSNVTGVSSLGPGGAALLVGSTDGFLYAVDACSLNLRWAKMLGASVSEPIVGDTDGDGEDEIVVGVADGSIVALDTPRCPSPASVSFVGASDKDQPISLLPGETLEVTFAEVAEATAYEFALVGPDDQALWSPPYRNAPGSTFSVELQGVLAERPYRIAVRARGPNGASPETFSPVLHINDKNAPMVESAVNLSISEGKMAIALATTDDIALDRWMVEMGGENGWFVAGEGLLDGPKAEVVAKIAPPPVLFGKQSDVRIEIVDSAGNTTSLGAQVIVDETGAVLAFAESLKEPLPPGDISQTGQRIDNGYFDCGISRRPSSGAPWILMLALALGLVRRPRH